MKVIFIALALLLADEKPRYCLDEKGQRVTDEAGRPLVCPDKEKI